MTDIKVYQEGNIYQNFQHLRLDYPSAISASLDLADKHSKHLNEITMSDFCCGTGTNTKKFAERLGKIKKATLIDINSKFLELAKLSPSPIQELEIINGNVLQAKVSNESDIVLSIFAYHHISDEEKRVYIKKIKEALKKDGILILTEIYIPNREIAKEYYHKLIKEIPETDHIPGLEEFLKRTSENTDFEFKVPKEIADKQFEEEGFRKVEEVKVRPLDNSFEEDIGTFVQVYTH
jgi:ubiquinone/menaquinone biosynthesis C-methylase UbiE